jgi:transcription elongation GreA/GreB family factor
VNKKALIQYITRQISDELTAITQAAKNTYDIATHEDNKPENKYDTRGLEASYLAGAQAKRVTDMKEVLAIFENLPIQDFSNSSAIQRTALVEVRHNDKVSFVLIMPKGGGQSVVFEGQAVQVITAESPLGQALMGRKVEDEIEVQTGSILRHYEILSIC